jgi:hypothetical protein
MYEQPRVEISKLPENYQPRAMAIFQQPGGGPTVTRPALQGSLLHASRWEQSHPGRRVVELLMTGGTPSTDACQPNTVADCVAAATASSSKTYVIGFGTDTTPLEPIAAAGGGEAFSVDIREMMTDRLGAIIQEIQDTETGCEWAVPDRPPPGVSGFDVSKLNVKVTGLLSATPSVPTFLTKVKGRQSCDAANLEWYFDDPSRPTRIIACNATCKAIHASTTTPVAKISLGCQSLTTTPAK